MTTTKPTFVFPAYLASRVARVEASLDGDVKEFRAAAADLRRGLELGMGLKFNDLNRAIDSIIDDTFEVAK
jgi:hypothetical protein